jgi:hypothetical protein
MGSIDLNAARAARAEARSGEDPKTLVVGDPPQSFTLIDECPAELGDLWVQGEWRAGLRLLLGDEQFDMLMSLRPPLSVPDLTALANAIAVEYGMGSAGESPASPVSSMRTSRRSRPTSHATTRRSAKAI